METSTKLEHDYLGFAGDKSIKALVKDENILFTDKTVKINRFGFSQERNIMITNKGIYNLKKKSLKRRIEIAAIRGLTITKLTDEFVIHGNDIEYDYDYVSSRRKKIVELIAKGYFEGTKREMKLCELDQKSLKTVVTSKKEKKKDANFSRMPNTNIIPMCTFLYGTKVETPELRKKTSTTMRSGTLYSKRKDITEVKLEDFKVLKVLGRGSFGKVCMVEYSPKKEIYAMKTLKKDVLIDNDQIENTLLEKKILESLDHPFLVGLTFCFQSEERIYFIMPFLRGGELFQHLRKFRIFDEEKTRFYSCQIAMALEHLHTYGIIYRDLKPENILMDDEGYLQLADFGMAKHLKGDEKAMSFCGTPEYLSPEIITGEGHNKSSDWWSFGILIYEMLCGIPPFYSENLERMYELIKFAELKFPRKINVSSDAQEIISKLLDRNPSTRLGAKGGINEIKSHPFFTTIDFDLVFKKRLNAPFRPEISDKYDVQNFDDEFTSEDVAQSLIPDKSLELIKKNQDKFKDFNKK